MKLTRILAAVAVAATFAAGAVDAKTLRINVTADPAMIDPITYSELIAGDVMKNMYEGFTDIDKDGNVVPALATRWEAHPDNRGFRFFLRQGVKFHSGRPFTARDVKSNFEMLLTPGARTGLTLQYLTKIEGAKAIQDGQANQLTGVTVVDDHTLDVRFTEPDVLFPMYPFQFFDSGIVAERGADWHQSVSAGTGPFRFVEWRRGQAVRLAAFPDYWGGAPAIEGVSFLVVPSDDTAISMYEANELDVVTLQPDTARRVLRDARMRDQLRRAPVAQVNYLGMNQNLYAPFKDIRVREAFCLAIDRQALVDGLYGGVGQPLNGQIAPGVAGFNPDVPPLRYDPERAKRLMAEAGFPEGRGMPPLKIANTSVNRNEATYYADQFRQVLGVPVDVDIQERATFIRAMNAGEVPFFSWGWTAGYPDALYFLSQMWHSRSPFNRPRWSNAEYDRLIDEASTVADNQARYALYHRAEKVLLDDWGTCGLIVRVNMALVKPGVSGVELTSFRYLPFGDVRIN
jgi:ABC-type transport system substrate-binding protein